MATPKEIRTVAAGLQFYDLPAVAEALQQGVRLRPQRDPANLHDRNAISLWLERAEAEVWDLLPLIADKDPHRQRWMLGHVQRELAADLAPRLDGGEHLDVFVAGGDRDGPWSVNLRLEGPAAEAVAGARARYDANAEAWREAVMSQHAEEGELLDAARILRRLHPDGGWDDVTVAQRAVASRPGEDLRYAERELRLRQGWEPSLSARDEWAWRLRQRRREQAEAAFMAAERQAEAERRAKRAPAAERQQLRRQVEALQAAVAALATALVDSSTPHVPAAVEGWLPGTWLTRDQILARGMRPEHCRVLGTTQTPHHTERHFYAGEVDPERMQAHRQARRDKAARRRRRQQEQTAPGDLPF